MTPLQTGMRVRVALESTLKDDKGKPDPFKCLSIGTLEESVSPDYAFTLRRTDGAIEPVYSEYVGQWHTTEYHRQKVTPAI